MNAVLATTTSPVPRTVSVSSPSALDGNRSATIRCHPLPSDRFVSDVQPTNAYEPIAVVAQPEIVDKKANVRRGRIFALNDTAETVKGELLVEYWTYDGKIARAERKSVTLPPDSSTVVGSFEGQRTKDNGQRPETFLVLTLTTPRGTYQNDWHFGFFKDMPLAKANVRLANASGEAESLPLVKNGNSITLVTDAPAFYVWANMTKCPGEFDDNCLTLLPGRPRTLRFGGNFNPKALSVTHLAELGK